MSTSIIDPLNKEQKEAVSAPLSNILVIAGAGTGKTRVLVSRIAWLLQVEMLLPREVLAVTFTNKAAREMRERIELIMGHSVDGLWANTFHSFSLRILRNYAKQAGLLPDFTVLDTDNQKKLIKRILKEELNVDIKKYEPGMIADLISDFKENGLRFAAVASLAENINQKADPVLLKAYESYEKTCQRENLVDFPELILRVVELLQNNVGVRELLQHRFKQILVDEFQDTNALQFKLLKLLVGPDTDIMAVGDDDQSIYGWRGADSGNMQKFCDEFAPVTKIKLIENYRSRQNILDLANVLIAHNSERLVLKELHGNRGRGGPVEIRSFANAHAEAEGIRRIIRILKNNGVQYKEIAVLYRNNRQSSLIETELGNYGIPYVVLGGMRFYDREEILNALAYAKVIINQNDDTSLLRIINVPSRKIGPAVIRELSAVAKERGISLYAALKEVYKYVEIDKKTDNKALVKLAKKISEFYSLIENLKKQKDNDLQDFMKNLIEQTGLREYYQLKDEKEQNKFKDNMREENLLELVNNAHIFNKSYERMFADVNEEEAQISPLTAFISNITLIGSGEMDEKGSTDEIDEGAVRLMTIHSAKGLEFNVVIVAGMEKNILPSVRSEKNKDEERRLAYVAITRAKEKLVLTYAMKRYNFAQELETTGASPFIEEIISGFDDELKALPYKYVNNQNML